jgi:CCR4-NOT transcription complex subunit 7/8
MKALSNTPLPEDETLFNEMLGIYFCNFYDVRQMIKNVTWLKGSLSRISTDLDLKRIGQSHQAGSDSLVTSKVFFKLLSNFNDHIDIFNDKNKLFGFSYKVLDEFEWNQNFNNNYNHFHQLHSFMGLHGNTNMNNLHSMNNLNKQPLSINNNVNPINSTTNKSPPNNMMYFPQNMNFNNMNPTMNPNMNHNMFYGGNNMNSGFNPMYGQQMDYNYYNNFYQQNSGGNNNGFKQGNNTGINNSSNKDNKFIQQ